jgi:prepilin-type N-terminal cleavage/methylation domain-containing protein
MPGTTYLHRRAAASRPGFTLVELLVVIAIITLMVAITAGTAMQVMSYQRSSNTGTTIQMINSALERQWKAVVDQARNETVPADVASIAYSASSPPANNDRRARIIWTKLRLKQIFPMNYSEALAPWQLPPQFTSPPLPSVPPVTASDLPRVLAYVKALSDAGITIANTSKDPKVWPTESAVTLLLALQQGYGGNTFSQDSLPASSLGQGPGTLKGLMDGWQQPICFYRWPLGNDDVNQSNPAGAAQIYRDPLDPEGLLLDPLWNNPTNYFGYGGVWWFEQYCHPVHVGDQSSYTPKAWYTVPIITSAGRNNRLGYVQPSAGLTPPFRQTPYPSPLLPDLMIPDPNDREGALDNIDSYRLRLGARGD